MGPRADAPRFSGMTAGHIVIGWDGTPAARDALALAKVVRAVAGGTLVPAAVSEHGVDAPAVLAAVERELPYGSAHRCEALAEGPPAERLLELARGLDAALIVLGPSSVHGPRAAIGSVAEKILHSSPCPVAVAPPGFASETAPGLRVIGVAFDGSDESWAALRAAEEIALAASGTLRVVGVLQPVVGATGGMAGFYGYGEPIEVSRDRLYEVLEEAAAAVDPRVRALPVLVRGEPAAELIRRSAALDLLVMGSRSHGPLSRVALGSTSSRVMRAGASPVLVVPRAAVGVTRAAA